MECSLLLCCCSIWSWASFAQKYIASSSTLRKNCCNKVVQSTVTRWRELKFQCSRWDNDNASEQLLCLSNNRSQWTHSYKTLKRWKNALCYKQQVLTKTRSGEPPTVRSWTCRRRSRTQRTCCCWVFHSSKCKTADNRALLKLFWQILWHQQTRRVGNGHRFSLPCSCRTRIDRLYSAREERRRGEYAINWLR